MSQEHYTLLLFISGMSVKSSHAIENLKRICDAYPKEKIKVEIIDISKDKAQALEYQIFAVPTLIKVIPAPRRVILGDLSDKEKVIKILELSE